MDEPPPIGTEATTTHRLSLAEADGGALLVHVDGVPLVAPLPPVAPPDSDEAAAARLRAAGRVAAEGLDSRVSVDGRRAVSAEGPLLHAVALLLRLDAGHVHFVVRRVALPAASTWPLWRCSLAARRPSAARCS